MKAFFIVWCPTGTSPPSHRHDTFEDAQREAERLAECAPRAEFFVLGALARSQKVTVRTEHLEGVEWEIPF